ncbi:rRNA-processing protein EBP2 [Paramarasmius palmivorus]|uniref:rRNA-processing protein EBP2 n=1 Tax=Paramarasmius palmivorus TaxID=297713 RepID=A0AAW0BXH2_9AGAR
MTRSSKDTLTDELKAAFAKEYRKQGGKSKLAWIKRNKNKPCERCVKDAVLCVPRKRASGGATQCNHCSQKGRCSKTAQERRERVSKQLNLTPDQYETLQAWYLEQSCSASTQGASPSVSKRKIRNPTKRTAVTEDSTNDNEKTRSPITGKRKRHSNTHQTASVSATATSSKRRTLAGGSNAVVPTRAAIPEDNNDLDLWQPVHALAIDKSTSFKRRTLAGGSNRDDSYDDETSDNNVDNVTPAAEDRHADSEHVYEDNDVDDVDKHLLTKSRAELEEGDHHDNSSDEELVYPPTTWSPKRRKTSTPLKARTPSAPILNTCSSPKERKTNAFSTSRSHSTAIVNDSFHDPNIVPETDDEAPSSSPEAESTPGVSSANLHDIHVMASCSPTAVRPHRPGSAGDPMPLNCASCVDASSQTVYRICGPSGSHIHIIVDIETQLSSNTGPAVHSPPAAIPLPDPTKVVGTLRDIQHAFEDLSTDFRFSRRPLQECVDLFNDNIDRLKNTITDIQ